MHSVMHFATRSWFVRLRMLQSGHCVFAVICNKVSAQMPKKHLADIKTDNSNKSLLQYRRNIENQQIEEVVSRGQDPKSQTKHLKHNSLMVMFVNFHKPEGWFELASRVLQLQRKRFNGLFSNWWVKVQPDKPWKSSHFSVFYWSRVEEVWWWSR